MPSGFFARRLTDNLEPLTTTHWRTFLMLAAWSIGGLIGCLAVFRWSDND